MRVKFRVRKATGNSNYQQAKTLYPPIHVFIDPRRQFAAVFQFLMAESCSEIIPRPPPGREVHLKRHAQGYSNQNQVLSWEFSLFLAGTTVARSMASLWISDGPQSYSYVYWFPLNNALSSFHGHPHSQCAYTWHDIVQSPSEVRGCWIDSRRSPWRPSHKHKQAWRFISGVRTNPKDLSQKTVILVS